MTGPLAQLWQIASDWVLAAAGLIGSATLGLVGAVYQNRERSKQNKRVLRDPDNPNTDSVADLAASNNEKLARLEDQHEDVMNRLDSIAEAVDDGRWAAGSGSTDGGDD